MSKEIKTAFVIVIILIMNYNLSGNLEKKENILNEPKQADDLLIIGGHDLINTYRSSGSGTLLDPYIIEREFDSDVRLLGISYFNTYIVFRNCTFNFRLQLWGCKYLNITNCTFGHNYRGIWITDDSQFNNIYENNFNNCTLDIEDSNNNLIVSNNFTLGGIRLYKSWDNIITNSNLLNGKPILYFEDESNTIIDDIDDIGQIILQNCTYFTISNLEIKDTSVGIQLHYSTNIFLNNINIRDCYQAILLNYAHFNTISNCNLSDNRVAGIWFWISNNNIIVNNTINSDIIDNNMAIANYASSRNVIENNTCFHSKYGIWVADNSDETVIRNNTVFNNEIGIRTRYADKTNITKCKSYDNEHGIYLEISVNSTVDNCNVFNNSRYGFYLERNDDCEFTLNNISNNRIGFYIDDESDNNIIWQNFFLNNTEYQAKDDGIGNKWNNATMGNYWSDFNYNDTYYQISGIANSTDYYPLMSINEETDLEEEPIDDEPTDDTSTDDDAPDSASDFPTGWVIGGAGVVVAIIGVAGVILLKRRK